MIAPVAYNISPSDLVSTAVKIISHCPNIVTVALEAISSVSKNFLPHVGPLMAASCMKGCTFIPLPALKTACYIACQLARVIPGP